MAQKDYLVVGLGLAGMSFCKYLIEAQCNFDVIDHGTEKASLVAGGLYNPIVLKRFSPIWLAKEQMLLANSFYADLENLLQTTFDYKFDVLRRFSNENEIKKWKKVAPEPVYREFMEPNVVENLNPALLAPFGFGKLNHTGRIDTSTLLTSFISLLKTKRLYQQETFDHTLIELKENGIQYGNHFYRKIVFTEGMHLKQNPFFNYLPVIPNKGQLIKVHCPGLDLQHIVKGPLFIVPDHTDNFWVGSTYERAFSHSQPTPEGLGYLTEKLKTLIRLPFTVMEHKAGVRPTVTDRRPLVGKHPKYKNLFIVNGLGSRGVLLGPFIARALFNYIEKNEALPKEADIARFRYLYQD